MIAIACDHGGYEHKLEIKKYLDARKFPYTDFGTESTESCDYPYYAKKVAEAILKGEAEKGILICGTGIGMSMAANRFPGIRAAVCTNEFMAEATRSHNNANILCLGGRVIDAKTAIALTDIFLNTPFSEGERHTRRVRQIDEKE